MSGPVLVVARIGLMDESCGAPANPVMNGLLGLALPLEAELDF
jgi:hypothetical protein